MKKKIAIANTLKPADDVRAYEKIAQSIAKTNKYEVNIIGNLVKKKSGCSEIHFYAHFLEKNAIIKRIMVKKKVLSHLLRINPNVIIITTHELLDIAFILKIFRGSKVIYDVQEDYKKNMLYLSTFPLLIKVFVANAIRLKEKIVSPFIDQFWLAEKVYNNELHFTQKKSLILENYATGIKKRRMENEGLALLFSGTISNYSNVLLAVSAYRKTAEKKPNSKLVIIGQYHNEKLAEKLEKFASEDSGIELHISSNPVPHEDIIDRIFASDLGLVTYQENEVNKNKSPTKIYEYSRYGLPYLIQKNTQWASKSKALGGAIPVDYHKLNIDFILNQVSKKEKLFKKKYPESKTWESQESLIFDSLDTLLK